MTISSHSIDVASQLYQAWLNLPRYFLTFSYFSPYIPPPHHFSTPRSTFSLPLICQQTQITRPWTNYHFRFLSDSSLTLLFSKTFTVHLGFLPHQFQPPSIKTAWKNLTVPHASYWWQFQGNLKLHIFFASFDYHNIAWTPYFQRNPLILLFIVRSLLSPTGSARIFQWQKDCDSGC